MLWAPEALDFDLDMRAVRKGCLECFLVPRKCMRRIPDRDRKGRGCAGLCNLALLVWSYHPLEYCRSGFGISRSLLSRSVR